MPPKAFTASVPRPEALSTKRPAPEPNACEHMRMKHGDVHVRACACGTYAGLALRAEHYLARTELRRAMKFHRVVRHQEGALLHQDVAAPVQVDELDVSHLFSAERGVAVVRRRDCLDEEGFATEDRAE
jgi:hypothetical protein